MHAVNCEGRKYRFRYKGDGEVTIMSVRDWRGRGGLEAHSANGKTQFQNK